MSPARFPRTTVLGLVAAIAAAAVAWSIPSRRPTHVSDAPETSSATIRDDAGRRFAPDEAAGRIVSLVPALTEALLELGAGERLVARTRYDRQTRLADLPSVGATTSPSLEVLLGTRPDLVIWWADEGSPRTAERLRDEGVRVYTARVMDFADLRRHVRSLGIVVGRAPVADSLVQVFDRALARASAPAVQGRRPTVAFVVWPRPLSVAGPGTFVHRIIRLAGGSNAFGDARLRWPRPSPESLVARDPDVLLLPDRDGETGFPAAVLDDPPWSFLSAVCEDRIVRLPADLLERPTLRSPRAVRLLAARLRALSNMSGDAKGGSP